MHAEKAVREPSLEFVLEKLDVAGSSSDSDIGHVLVRHPVRHGIGAEVTLQASRVVAESSCGTGLHAVHTRVHRSKVDCHAVQILACLHNAIGAERYLLDEGTTLYAATALAGRQPDGAGAAETAIMLHEGTVATETRVATIEDWRLGQIILVLEPVPVLFLLIRSVRA